MVIDTPDGIAFARLAALKGALDLQSKGIRLSRSFSATQIGKSQYGLTGSAAKQHAAVAQQVEDLIWLRENPMTHETFAEGQKRTKRVAAFERKGTDSVRVMFRGVTL